MSKATFHGSERQEFARRVEEYIKRRGLARLQREICQGAAPSVSFDSWRVMSWGAYYCRLTDFVHHWSQYFNVGKMWWHINSEPPRNGSFSRRVCFLASTSELYTCIDYLLKRGLHGATTSAVAKWILSIGDLSGDSKQRTIWGLLEVLTLGGVCNNKKHHVLIISIGNMHEQLLTPPATKQFLNRLYLQKKWANRFYFSAKRKTTSQFHNRSSSSQWYTAFCSSHRWASKHIHIHGSSLPLIFLV